MNTGKYAKQRNRSVMHLCSAGAGLGRVLIARAIELGIVPLSRSCHLSYVRVDEGGDGLNTVVEEADRGHRLAKLLGELPDSVEVLPEVVAHGLVVVVGAIDGYRQHTQKHTHTHTHSTHVCVCVSRERTNVFRVDRVIHHRSVSLRLIFLFIFSAFCQGVCARNPVGYGRAKNARERG